MAYRMKRNGAGLASICILSTMMLVTVSSTTCVYTQVDQAVEQRYTRDINISMYDEFTKAPDQSITEPYIEAMSGVLGEYGMTAQDVQKYYLYDNYGIQAGDQFKLNMYEDEANGTLDYSSMIELYFITLADYNALTGENRELGEDEMLVCPMKMEYNYDTLTIEEFGTWNVEKLDAAPVSIGSVEANMNGSLILVVKGYFLC